MALRTRQELLKDLATNYVTQTTLDSGSKFSEPCCFFLSLSLLRLSQLKELLSRSVILGSAAVVIVATKIHRDLSIHIEREWRENLRDKLLAPSQLIYSHSLSMC